MQDSQATFHSANGRRLVLIVEDEAVNREILGTILGNDFDVKVIPVNFSSNGNSSAYNSATSKSVAWVAPVL